MSRRGHGPAIGSGRATPGLERAVAWKESPARMMRASAVLALLTALGACAPSPDVSSFAQGDPHSARTLLARAGVDGPIRLELRGLPASIEVARIETAADAGARYLNARFRADPTVAGRDVPRLVIAFGAVPGALGELCRPAAAPATTGDPATAAAAFCDSVGAVAAIKGRAVSPLASDMEQLVTSLTRRLFPDDYADSYGWGLGTGVSLGGWWGSSGGSGIGVGVGF